MKLTRKVFALMLAISIVFSAISVSVFADDDAVESPIIPIPGGGVAKTFEYSYDEETKTAILNKFAPNIVTVVVPSTVFKDGTEYAVVGIADEVFKATSIKSVEISEGVVSIGENAFKDCAKLTTVTIPASVTDIAETAFDGTAWLENQPDGVVYAGKVAYKVKGTLPSMVVLSADTVSIATGAFRDQTTEFSIVIPQNTVVSEDAFAGCTNVTFYCYEGSSAYSYAGLAGINCIFIPSLILRLQPTKTEYYQGDALNFAGMELVYITEVGETPVTVTDEMVSGYAADTLGTQTVTITYEGKSVSFEVTVVERPAFIPGDVDNSNEVNTDDAVYLLFHVMFPERYEVSQPVDFDGQGGVTTDDAVYLLFHVMFPDRYPIA